MTTQSLQEKRQFKQILDGAIRLGLVFLMVAWCIDIIKPFIVPIAWGIIIGVAVHPLYLRLEAALGNRRALAATLFTLLVFVLLIIPVLLLSASMVETGQYVSQGLEDGTLRLPPPPDSVSGWPFVGERLHAFWQLASTNLAAALEQATPQLETLGNAMLRMVAGAGAGMLQFVLAIIIAGVFLANAQSGARITHAIAKRLTVERGDELADLAGATVRSVAQGVLGVALIQSILAGLGMLVMEVPGAGFWALLVLLLAIVQLPPLLVLGPVIFYVFSYADTLPAVLFTIWSLLVSASDGVLKPLLLGRGVEVPMLVILIGAIGGMMSSGIIGLFVGSVILALGYKLFIAWLYEEQSAEEESSPVADNT